jgi:ribosome-associated protein
MTSEEKIRALVRAADSKHARNMVLLDLRGRTLLTDFLFICGGASQVHIRTITDHIVETMKHSGLGGIRVEGYEAARWVLMDYQDVVAHVMSADQREYYDLELIWRDAPRIAIENGEPQELRAHGD